MVKRLTYVKRGDDISVWVAEYENLTLKIGSSETEGEVEKTYDSQEALLTDLEKQCKQQEKKGYKLVGDQTFIDLENPTVDELESQILLRYKIIGVTDTVLLRNARAEAIKMLKNESGEREDYDLDSMQFVVDLNNHDSLKNLLQWQIDNFEAFVAGVQSQYSVAYGHIDGKEFVAYETEDGPSYESEAPFYRAAAKHEDLRPLIIEFIEKIGEANDEDDSTIFRDEETPLGTVAAFELAMADKKYLRNYIDFCNTFEIKYYYARFEEGGEEGGHIPKLLEKWGYDENDDLLMEFLASQMVQRDHQHSAEDIGYMMSECGLEEAMEGRVFADRLLHFLVLRAIYIFKEKLGGSRQYIKWPARDLANALDGIGIEANKEMALALMEMVMAGNPCPTVDELENMEYDGEEDEEEDEDEDDDDDDDDDDDEDTSRYFTFEDDKSSKFWRIEVDGCEFTTTYGKIGSEGQSSTKDFDDEETCEKEAEKLVREKVKKGYVERGGNASAPKADGAGALKSIPKYKAPKGADLVECQYVVDITNPMSIASVLKHHIDNFDDFLEGVQEGYNLEYGTVDEDGEFEEIDCPSAYSEEALFDAAITFPELLPLLEKYAELAIEASENETSSGPWSTEETLVGQFVIPALAMHDKKYLPLLEQFIAANVEIRFSARFQNMFKIIHEQALKNTK